MAKTPKYEKDAKLYNQVAWSLASKGYTNEEIATTLNISIRTYERWLSAYPEFKASIREGRDLATAQVERALFNRAVGFKSTETERIQKIDGDGNAYTVKLTTKEKTMAPDTAAATFWLKNRDSEHWKEKVEVEKGAGSGLAEALIAQIAITNEADLERKVAEDEKEGI